MSRRARRQRRERKTQWYASVLRASSVGNWGAQVNTLHLCPVHKVLCQSIEVAGIRPPA